MADDRFDPYGGYNFSVRIGGIERAGFRECSGLDSSQNGIESGCMEWAASWTTIPPWCPWSVAHGRSSRQNSVPVAR